MAVDDYSYLHQYRKVLINLFYLHFCIKSRKIPVKRKIEYGKGDSVKEIIENSAKTPIEIALGIGEDGKTTARKLYEFWDLQKDSFPDGLKSISQKTHLLKVA